jgi:hypothetical protein
MKRARPEYDPLGVTVGAFRLSPSLTAGESYDDNIYAVDDNPTSDFLTLVKGGTGVQWLGQHPSISANAGFSSLTYAHNSAESHLDWNGGLSISEPLIYRTVVGADALVARTHSTRDDPSIPVTAVEPPSLDTRTGILDVLHEFAAGTVHLSETFRNFDYNAARLSDHSTLSQNFKDRNEIVLDFRSDFAVGRTTSAFLHYIHTMEEYRADEAADGLDRNSTIDTVAIGSSFAVTNLMQGELAVGALRLRNHDPRQGGQTTVAFRGHLDIYLTQLMTGTLTFERTTGTADIVGSASFVETDASAGLDYELRRNIILSGNVSWAHRHYTGLDVSASTSSGALKALWLLNRDMKLNLAYTLAHRNSPLQTYLGQNYTDRVASLSLDLAL